MTRLTRQLLSLHRLLPGRGRADAPRVWLALWGHVRWKSKKAEVWVGDLLLARETGLDVRRVQRALLLLEQSGLIWRRVGKPYRARKTRRIIELAPGIARDRQPKICPPPPECATNLRLDVGDLRERPSATISLFWAIYVAAQMNGGNEAHTTLAALQEMTATRSRPAFYERLEDLARAGLIEKIGDSWCEGIRVLRYVPQALPTIAPAEVTKMPLLPEGRMVRAEPAWDWPPSSEYDDPGLWEAVG